MPDDAASFHAVQAWSDHMMAKLPRGSSPAERLEIRKEAMLAMRSLHRAHTEELFTGFLADVQTRVRRQPAHALPWCTTHYRYTRSLPALLCCAVLSVLRSSCAGCALVHCCISPLDRSSWTTSTQAAGWTLKGGGVRGRSSLACSSTIS